MTDTGQSAGPATDRAGAPVVDPTANVLAVVDAAVRRQDDLRLAEQSHIRELLAFRAEHYRDLREAESARIDAIRAVDAAAVQRASDVAGIVANTLAAQVATSAEALRTQVDATAAAQTAALNAALVPMQKDIADLRRVQYEAAGGKASVREGTVERRASWGVIAAAVGLGMTLVFGVIGVLIALLVRG